MSEQSAYGYTESGLYIPNPAHMARAIELGHACIETDDHPVGAIVVSATGEILGEGKNEVHARQDPTAHAERIAIDVAAQNVGRAGLKDGVLFTSHECCPMCSGAVVNTKLAGVVCSTDVDDITDLLARRQDMKWRSNTMRMATILNGRRESGMPQQFMIGSLHYQSGLVLLERTIELAV
ncbi:MAG: tRNA-specific adenosine deaminase [Candidatus Saccharibacteria bacterium]|nr:tRNA-specific adenosine deaminase [Candidatus Saccharibacteria bacterium]